jgi:peptide/nickel transport system substrate-binding protein
VIIRESADCDKINPYTSSSANSRYVESNIFMGLLETDPNSLELVGSLAIGRPVVTELTEGEYKGGMSITYELRPEAKWDNGTPVLASDVVFTMKAVKNPKTDCENIRPYFEFISDIVVDPSNTRKFTFFCKEKYFTAEENSAITVIPEQSYDPEGIMKKFTIKELNDPSKLGALKGNPDIIKFAESFNKEATGREPKNIVGCGPYVMSEWVTGQRIVLKRKASWWGDQLKGKFYGFEANPTKITYEIIIDEASAKSSLLGEKIDIHQGIPAKDFLDLEKTTSVTDKYNAHKPDQFAYSYFGLNMRNNKLSDVKVRQALSYLVDVDKIIKVVSYGMARRVTGPISFMKPYYNKDITPVPYDVAKATALLDEAGWKDSDGDGMRDKMIDGKKVDLTFELKYPSGNPSADKIASMLQEWCKSAGVGITTTTKEWTVFIDDTKRHNFEIYFGSWIGSHQLDEMKQIWHTESYNGGSNYVGFGTVETDQLIEKIRYELNEEKRSEYYKQMQKIISDQVPYIFVSSPKNRIFIHKRFDNANTYVLRPGFFEKEFRLNPDFGK